MDTNEPCQASALALTKSEAETLLKRLSKTTFLAIRGIEVYAVPMTEPFIMGNGSKHEGAIIMVRAGTERACGMGVGFVVAISEGLR